MKKLSLFILIALTCFACMAQSLERQVISSTGNFSSAGNLQVSSTVGEAMVETFTSGSLILLQGFQQPSDNDNVAIDDLEVVLDYKIYPNPTTDRLFISLYSDNPLTLSLRLTDMTGRYTGIEVTEWKVNGPAEKELDLSRLASGQYTLHLLDSENQAQKTFKVVKID